MLQKYAVRVAGGVNHRMCLADAALIKDNHVIAAGGVVPAYRAVRAAFPDIGVQVEVTTGEQAREVVAAGATEILLDNMAAEQMRRSWPSLGGRATFEASGGLRLSDATSVAQTGVDYVAVGAITHSAQILDIALDLTTQFAIPGNVYSCQVVPIHTLRHGGTMAQRVQIILEDDFDGGKADETVTFALDGAEYEIDLSAKNAAGSARRNCTLGCTRPQDRRTAQAGCGQGQSARSSTSDIRAWALANGHEVSSRGRVSAEVREAYEKAHA